MRAYLIDRQIEDIRQVLFRQTQSWQILSTLVGSA